MHFCSFGSDVEDLKRKDRNEDAVLEILKTKPRISTFTLSEHWRWLPSLIESLKRKGLIEELEEPYPWHKFEVKGEPNE